MRNLILSSFVLLALAACNEDDEVEIDDDDAGITEMEDTEEVEETD